MRYKGKIGIKTLIAAGLLTLNLSGCKREIKQYINIQQEYTNSEEQTKNKENAGNIEVLVEDIEIEEFKQKLKESFETNELTLDETTDKLISSIIIDGTNVSIELYDKSKVSGDLCNLKIFDVTLENLYIYDSEYTRDFYNAEEKYKDYEKNGYTNVVDALFDDYANHKKLELEVQNCYINNEYKKGDTKDINYNIKNLDYTACKRLWLYDTYLHEKDDFSMMPNLETLILAKPQLTHLEEETISIQSDSLKNIIIDGQIGIDYIDKFDFTRCPNLEIVSITSDSQETDLDGLKGLNNLKELAFGLPTSKYYDTDGLIYKDFQERIDLVSSQFPSNDRSLTIAPNCIISDISAINGTNIEVINISFLQCINSDMLLETVKSLPKLKEIVGFEVNNAGMCSDELLKYCEEHKIIHPFTEKSLEIKHKLEEIVSNVITEDMSEEEKIKALSEYVVSNMEYNFNLIDYTDNSTERIIKGWGECLYYSVIEGEGVCQGYTKYAQNLFNEAEIKSFKTDGVNHTWNLVQIDNEYYFVDLTNVDELIDEQKSTSFDDYNLDKYYLVPIEDFFRTSMMLPVEVEKQCNETEEKEESQYTEKLESYIIQANRENINQKEYSKFCGIIGILCALGLAKKVANKEKVLEKMRNSKDKEGVIKLASLKEVLDMLKRNQKLEQLRSKREIARRERIENNKAKQLEIETNQVDKGENIR